MPAFPNRQRLLVITLMTGIVVALVLGTTMAWTAMQQFHVIESQFQELSLQDFRLMRGLRSRTNQLHSAAMRFAVTQDRARLHLLHPQEADAQGRYRSQDLA